jgi:uncharacterized protein YbjQ (UPF0145 family)
MIENHKRVTGLSGNEIFCLGKIGMQPGQLCIGNSVVSIGIAGGIGAGLSALGGGEVADITRLVHNGRQKSFDRMMEEARRYGGVGIAGVSFDMITHGGNIEFITVASTVHSARSSFGPTENPQFSTSADAQQLYCQMDSGFVPVHFVFGNVAYSIGLGGNVTGSLRSLKRGEIPEFSKIFDRTRHLALTRITDEAKTHRANAVLGIQTTIAPLMGIQEMIMVGTASRHPALTAYFDHPVTSDMTNEEMWNMCNMGYLPVQLVMGVSVYSLGLAGGVLSALQSLGGGEIGGLTELLYEAREKALARIERDAELCGADQVVGVKTRVYDLGGGLVEFMAIGTAVKRIDGARTKTDVLPPQAIIQDRETFVDATDGGSAINLDRAKSAPARTMQRGPRIFVFFALLAAFYLFRVFFLFHH